MDGGAQRAASPSKLRKILNDMGNSVILRASAVRHAYGKGESKCEALRGFSLEVGEGEFVALMGPSGSGKSTVLHLAAGLLLPTSGSIEVCGTEVTHLGDAAAAKFRRRSEGVVFQSFNLIDSLTVAENIILPARLDHAKIDAARLADLVAKLPEQERSSENIIRKALRKLNN